MNYKNISGFCKSANIEKKGKSPKFRKEVFPLKDGMDSKDSVLGIKDILVSKRKDIYMNILKL